VLVLYGLSQGGRGQNVWDGWQESPELWRPAYAERVRGNDVFRTRANTWSNLTYVLDLFRADGPRALFWMALAGVALALAVVCRQLDVAGRFSGPDSWLQGHAFWHLLTSGSLGCMYLYQRSGPGQRQAGRVRCRG
jgi:hypothetical protein